MKEEYSISCATCGNSLSHKQRYYCSRKCVKDAWSDEDINKLRLFYKNKISIDEISKGLRRTKGAIRNKAYKLQFTDAGAWSETDIEYLKNAYIAITPLDVIAAQLNRSFASVACKAHNLEITTPGVCVRTDEWRKNASDRIKKWWRGLDDETRRKIVTHPCSEATKKQISKSLKTSEAYKEAMRNPKRSQKLSDNLKKRQASGLMRKGFSKGRQGIRKDINLYVRSSWEANYARYLNLLKKKKTIKSWRYEPIRFEFPKIKRGTRSYLPDFEVTKNNGSIEWHEVKGYMTQKGQTALKRFKKYYPEETLILIDKNSYKNLEQKYSDTVENWEK